MIHKGKDSLTVCAARVIRKSNSSCPWSPWGCGGSGVEGFKWPLVLFWGDAHLERCKDCWQLSDWAALGPAGPLLALHCLLLVPIPVVGTICWGAGSQTSHQWCPRLSRPWANSLLKHLSYFSFSWGCDPQVIQHLTVDSSVTKYY